MTNTSIQLGTEAGVPYGYIVADYRPEGATKLLVSLHGFGERGNGTTELSRVAKVGAAKLIAAGSWKRREFVVVSPQLKAGSTQFYHTTLHSFILAMCKKYNISPSQVYLMGMSGGANSIFAYLLNYKANNALDPSKPQIKVVAATCIAGTVVASKGSQVIDTKLYVTHGEKDEIMSYVDAKGFVDTYNAANPAKKAVFKLFPFEAHVPYVWDTTYKQQEIYDFMLN